jgi:hypothetical protein
MAELSMNIFFLRILLYLFKFVWYRSHDWLQSGPYFSFTVLPLASHVGPKKTYMGGEMLSDLRSPATSSRRLIV